MSILTHSEIKTLHTYSENMTWLREHYADLTKDYADKFVAVDKGKVVDSDSNPERLLRRVREATGDEGAKSLAVEYVPLHEMELIL